MKEGERADGEKGKLCINDLFNFILFNLILSGTEKKVNGN